MIDLASTEQQIAGIESMSNVKVEIEIGQTSDLQISWKKEIIPVRVISEKQNQQVILKVLVASDEYYARLGIGQETRLTKRGNTSLRPDTSYIDISKSLPPKISDDLHQLNFLTIFHFNNKLTIQSDLGKISFKT